MNERTNNDWVTELRAADKTIALEDLRVILLRGLRAALSNRIQNDLDNITEDFVQDALLKILDNIDSFRGESKFTTWAQKIAIHVAYTELRRRRWKDISLQQMVERVDGNDFTPAILTAPESSPEKQTVQESLLEFVRKMIAEELTERQRTALVATMIHGVPMEEVARRMETNRNALYKLIYDARQRLQRSMEENGISPQDVLAAFD